jgi:hypothetical protein
MSKRRQGMARFMDSGDRFSFSVMTRERRSEPHEHFVLGLFEIVLVDQVLVGASGQQGRLVTRLARSAPEKPVNLATISRSTSGARERGGNGP